MRKLSLLSLSLLFAACSPSVASLTLEPGALILQTKGETKDLKATPKKENGELNADALLKLKWSSSNPAVATVVNGTVTAVRSGDAAITAEIGEVKAVTRVRVSIPASVDLEPKEIDVPGLDKTVDVKAVVKDDAGHDAAEPPLAWSTASATVATFADGKVKGVGIGKTTLEVSVGGLKASASVNVHHPEVAKMEILPGQRELEKVGDAVRLVATLADPSGANIRGLSPAWISSDEKIATVSAEGLVTAVKKGKVKITATAGAQTAEVEIVVKGLK